MSAIFSIFPTSSRGRIGAIEFPIQHGSNFPNIIGDMIGDILLNMTAIAEWSLSQLFHKNEKNQVSIISKWLVGLHRSDANGLGALRTKTGLSIP